MKRTIELNGEEHHISFGITTLKQFKKECKIDFLNQSNNKPLGIDEVSTLFYLALKNGARINGEKFNYSEDDVCDWFYSFQEILAAMEMMGDSMPKVEVEGAKNEKKLTPVK